MPYSLKRRLRTATDQAARVLGILPRRERELAGALTILMYHRVLPEDRCADYPFRSLAMPVEAFREQVRWLASQGEVLTLSAALDRLESSAPPSRPLFALTFDDGYCDSNEIVAGILEEAGLRGTFFVTTGFVARSELLWFDQAFLLFSRVDEEERKRIVLEIVGRTGADSLPEPGADAVAWTTSLKRHRPAERKAILTALEAAVGAPRGAEDFRAMSAAQVVDLHRRGHEIGSHTVTHAMLPDLDDAELASELEESKQCLGAWLGTEVPGFCYPNGNHDDRVVARAAAAGYAYGCTTQDGIHRRGDDRWRIRRVDIVPDRVVDGSRGFDATAFRRELCGLYRRRERGDPNGREPR